MLVAGFMVNSVASLPSGQIQVQLVNGAGAFHRYVLAPGDDLTNEYPSVVATANDLWSAPVVAAWQAQVQAAHAEMEAKQPPCPAQISDRQFFQQLAIMGVISTADALAAVKVGTIPADLQTFVDTLPEGQRFAAEMLLSGATTFDRQHPMTLALGAGMGWTAEQLDALWQAAAAI